MDGQNFLTVNKLRQVHTPELLLGCFASDSALPPHIVSRNAVG